MRERVQSARRAGDACGVDRFEEIERDLHETCLAPVPNRRLIATIRQSRLPDVINRVFAQHFGLHETEAALREHDLVFAELLKGNGEGAAQALELHLQAAMERTRARLKVLSVLNAREIASLSDAAGRRTRARSPSRAERREQAGQAPPGACACWGDVKSCWSPSGGRRSATSASRSPSNSSTALRRFARR